MKNTEIKFAHIYECPESGCKRGFYSELWLAGTSAYICPEHGREMLAVFEDEKGHRYLEVDKFGDSLKRTIFKQTQSP